MKGWVFTEGQNTPLKARHNHPTMEPQDLQDHELKAQAHEWRTRALRGDKKARGIAHALEREVRRRFSTPANDTVYESLDLRSLEQRQEVARRPSWKFW